MLRAPFLLLVLATLASACAVADNGDDGVIVHHDGGGDARDTGSSFEDTGAADDTGNATDSISRVDTATSDDTGSGFDSGTTFDTGPGDTGGPACKKATAADCTSGATALSTVSGDTGSDVATASGSNGEFLRVYVTENDSSLFSTVDLSVRITLTSPPGENFDLYVYEGPLAGDGGGVECTSVAGSSTTSGVDVVNLGWPDEHPIGGHDDSRNLSIEVRPVSLTCDPSAKWTLKVEGHV